MLRDLTILQQQDRIDVLAHADVIRWPDGQCLQLHLVQRYGLPASTLCALMMSDHVEVFDLRCIGRELAADLAAMPDRDVPGLVSHYARHMFAGPDELLARARQHLTACWFIHPQELAA